MPSDDPRLPPLPAPSALPTPEQLARRAVGDRTVDVPVKPITVGAYDPGWPARYRREEARIRAALGARVLVARVPGGRREDHPGAGIGRRPARPAAGSWFDGRLDRHQVAAFSLGNKTLPG